MVHETDELILIIIIFLLDLWTHDRKAEIRWENKNKIGENRHRRWESVRS